LTSSADFDADQQVNFADISAFIVAWLEAHEDDC
jgi:hypothetical protein